MAEAAGKKNGGAVNDNPALDQPAISLTDLAKLLEVPEDTLLQRMAKILAEREVPDAGE